MRRMLGMAVVLASTAFAAPGLAQDADDVLSHVREVSQRLEREWTCIRDKQIELEQTVRLIREAEAQMRRTRAGTPERRDAEAAIESLSQRALRLEREALECRTEPSEQARSGQPIGGVVYREETLAPNERAVEQRNPATRVMERDSLLQGNVRAVVGEQVDGRGRIEASVVKAAIRGIASRLDRCYGSLVDRSALRRGTIILVFTVTARGRVTDIRTERNEVGDHRFERCVRAAARRLDPSAPAVGGEATLSYTLGFPAR